MYDSSQQKKRKTIQMNETQRQNTYKQHTPQEETHIQTRNQIYIRCLPAQAKVRELLLRWRPDKSYCYYEY